MKQSLTVLKFVIVSIISLLSVLQLSYAAEEITYYHNDVSGSPLLATNASGNVLWKESYRPYGDKLTKSVASQNNKIGFHGKPFDDDTGLSYMQARYYDPILGRFTGMDPVDYQENNLHSFNRYAYANNNPYKYVDPDGNHPLIYMLGVGLGAISLADGEPPQAKAFKLAPTAVGVKQGMATEAKALSSKSSTIRSNNAQGKAFEDQVEKNLSKQGLNVGKEITVKTQSGVRTRLDFLTKDKNGNIGCVECKSSPTAPLTRNQKQAFPEIGQSGATVVGKGKPGFPNGTYIPPSEIKIKRP